MDTTKRIEEDLFENIIVTLTFGTGMAALVSPINNFLGSYSFSMSPDHVYMLAISFLSSIISNSLGTIKLLRRIYTKELFKFSIGFIVTRIFVTIKLIILTFTSNFWKGICSVLDIVSFTVVFLPIMDFLKHTTKYGDIKNIIPISICIILFVTSYYTKKCILLLMK